jgi:hypothetical protein
VAFTDGTFLVPTEVKPGLYHTLGGDHCYWERDKDMNGTIDSIADNGNFSGPTTIQIRAIDKALTTNGGCTWTRIG